MNIKIYNAATISPEDFKRLMRRSFIDISAIKTSVRSIMDEIKIRGDDPIWEKYQSRHIPISNLRVTEQEITLASRRVSKKFWAALRQTICNIRTVHQRQLNRLMTQPITHVWKTEITVWRAWRSIESIGIYVPGGRANYPSTFLMCVIPAQIAGCRKITVCVPPDSEGKIPPEVITAADTLGVKNLFKVGGPQAIAAMAYGTKTIPKALKIVGPGNQYVTAAKLLVYPTVDIDMPAGPSENLIIADKTANPVFVAADLITDAEHGPDSTGLMVTPSETLARAVQKEVAQLAQTLETKEIIQTALQRYGGIIIVRSLNEAIRWSNEYAPEHLQLMTKNPIQLAKRIVNAGSVFIGPWTSKSAGDYAIGANHVLPTGQTAKMFAPLSVESFGRLVQFQKATKTGLANIRQAVETFAEAERLPAHKLSCSMRFE